MAAITQVSVRPDLFSLAKRRRQAKCNDHRQLLAPTQPFHASANQSAPRDQGGTIQALIRNRYVTWLPAARLRSNHSLKLRANGLFSLSRWVSKAQLGPRMVSSTKGCNSPLARACRLNNWLTKAIPSPAQAASNSRPGSEKFSPDPSDLHLCQPPLPSDSSPFPARHGGLCAVRWALPTGLDGKPGIGGQRAAP